MSDNERIGAKLAGMGAEVRRAVTPPPASAVRRRAEHQQRVRRTATAALAAAAVLAIAVGAISVVRDSATPPPPPTTTPTPSTSPSPSPRPARSPWPERKVTDPIGKTNWDKATITLPPREGCPDGRVRFTPTEMGARSSGYPRAELRTKNVVYGDVTGDSRPEAVLPGWCLTDAQDSGDGADRLLVVTRGGDGLRALGWVGPAGAYFASHWIEDGVLYADVHPHHEYWDYRVGAAQGFRWTGNSFASAGTTRYPGVAPDVPVDLTPVAGRTGCPAPLLRFGADGRATADGVTFGLEQPPFSPHLVDLDGDGVRRLLVRITCGGASPALVVLDRRDGGGFVALDAIGLPRGEPLTDWTCSRGELTVEVAGQVRKYVWYGTHFES